MKKHILHPILFSAFLLILGNIRGYCEVPPAPNMCWYDPAKDNHLMCCGPIAGSVCAGGNVQCNAGNGNHGFPVDCTVDPSAAQCQDKVEQGACTPIAPPPPPQASNFCWAGSENHLLCCGPYAGSVCSGGYVYCNAGNGNDGHPVDCTAYPSEPQCKNPVKQGVCTPPPPNLCWTNYKGHLLCCGSYAGSSCTDGNVSCSVENGNGGKPIDCTSDPSAPQCRNQVKEGYCIPIPPPSPTNECCFCINGNDWQCYSQKTPISAISKADCTFYCTYRGYDKGSLVDSDYCYGEQMKCQNPQIN